MPLNVSPPKYAQVASALQQRITDGTYRPGDRLPTEAVLIEEFGASRTTVVKALDILRQEGWIESQQGRASTVRGVPVGQSGAPDYARAALEADESADVRLLRVGPILATHRIASALDIPQGDAVYERSRITTGADGPIIVSSAYVPVDIAVGTPLTQREPLPGGVLEHLGKGRQVDYVTTRISSRMPTEDEAKLLAVGPDVPLLCVLVTGYATGGAALVAVDEMLPADRHDLEDTYPLRP